jgi:hypothetical protein
MKSLHFNIKKKELERIEKENFIIAQKIVTARSSLRNKDLIEAFDKHLYLKDNINRIKRRKYEGNIKLPAI